MVDVVEGGVSGLAGESSFSFGKIIKHFDCGWSPSPSYGLHDHELKLKTLLDAKAAGVEVIILEIFVADGGGACILKCGAEGTFSEAGSDCEIQGDRRALAPARYVDIGRPTGGWVVPFNTIFRESPLEWSWLQQARLFPLYHLGY